MLLSLFVTGLGRLTMQRVDCLDERVDLVESLLVQWPCGDDTMRSCAMAYWYTHADASQSDSPSFVKSFTGTGTVWVR